MPKQLVFCASLPASRHVFSSKWMESVRKVLGKPPNMASTRVFNHRSSLTTIANGSAQVRNFGKQNQQQLLIFNVKVQNHYIFIVLFLSDLFLYLLKSPHLTLDVISEPFNSDAPVFRRKTWGHRKVHCSASNYTAI